MEEKNKITRELIRIGQIVLGNTMYALAVVMFIVPNGLITGGTTGLALFASDVYKRQQGVFTLPLLIAVVCETCLII